MSACLVERKYGTKAPDVRCWGGVAARTFSCAESSRSLQVQQLQELRAPDFEAQRTWLKSLAQVGVTYAHRLKGGASAACVGSLLTSGL